ncbi:hypothetical protein ABZ468_46755 [Streptomyces sp. NPDC005708]|uniref:hypothetical protein n=1 Tax=Streptomyces sp. NPDC005708 TaxID=3154564 RepID=UPI0033DA7534
MRLGLAIVAVWSAAVVIADVALIRTHVLEETYTGISTGAGVIIGPFAVQLWYGALAGKAHVDRRQQRQLLSARTITGVRTIDLGALASVRRYELIGRFGGSTDELRLRDQHGVRLAVDSGDKAVIGAVREAVEAADARPGGVSLKASRHARARLGREPWSSAPEVGHAFAGFLAMGAATLASGLGSYQLACLLAGVGAW